MAIRIEEAYANHDEELDSDGALYSGSVSYFIFDCPDEKTALAYAKANVPSTLVYNPSSGTSYSIPLDRISIEERCSQNIWKIKAEYPHENKNSSSGETEEPEFSFDITAGTKHITHSIATVLGKDSSGKTVTDRYANAINVNAEGEIDGCDIVNCTCSFSEKHYVSNSAMTNSYKRKIGELVGKVNSGSFKGWSAGEVMFVGASGSRKGKTSKDKWEVTYRFNVNPNRTNVTVGGISIGTVEGWNYLWVKYKNDVDTTNNCKKKVVDAVFVEKVYERASFSDLT